MAPQEVYPSPLSTQKPTTPHHRPRVTERRGNPPMELPTIHDSGVSCPTRYVRYENSTCTNLCNPECKDCVPRCMDVLYTKQHKSFAYAWMAVWTSLCIVSTAFTIVTFCIDPDRFRYPTRPIIFMAFCYFMYSMSYFIPLFIPAKDIICKSESAEISLMIVNGMESTLCIIIFLIQYYFGIASHTWWLILTITWYLAASRKWGLEAINSIACYCHMLAWTLPAILTIAILVTGRVDSNELTGMCYVGNHDKDSLLYYIIVPLCLLLLVGQVFLLAGFVSLIRIRSNLKPQIDHSNIRKLEKLMAKIGVFAILYTVPAVCVLGSHVHEFINMNAWRCMSAVLTPITDTLPELTNSIPSVEIHMLKIFMSLIVGISISMWSLSSKTLKSCQRTCSSQKSDNNSFRIIQQRRYAKPVPASYLAAKATDSHNYVQHYKFPSRHHHSPTSMPKYHHSSRAGPVNL